ncbi:hypothetical protein DFH09DRAFT_1366144 [Mycena vulgaris]|nr:hypothetical protein DFH09DRAFT_1366144 [Mycena vulgaris]
MVGAGADRSAHVAGNISCCCCSASFLFPASLLPSSTSLLPAMDNPSWNDTLRASLSSCFPCLTRDPADSDTQNEDEVPGPEASFAIRRARADELEGLLADAHDGDDAADADAISLHSHLGPRGRRRAPPRTPKHIAFFGFNLFGSGRVKLPVDDAADPLHRPPAGANAARSRRAEALESTTNLLSRAALDAGPEQLSGEDIERRARRRARKEMRRLAAAVAQQEQPRPDDFEGFPGNGSPLTPSAHRGIPAPFLASAQDDEDAADLDGATYARLAPRGGSAGGSRSSGSGSGVGAEYEREPKKTKKRSTKSKSSTTSSTLHSPREEEFGAFALPEGTLQAFDGSLGAGDFDGTSGGFDGTPGGFDGGFDGTPGGFAGGFASEGFAREALPSPGLSAGRGFGFGDGGSNKGRGRGGSFLANA